MEGGAPAELLVEVLGQERDDRVLCSRSPIRDAEKGRGIDVSVPLERNEKRGIRTGRLDFIPHIAHKRLSSRIAFVRREGDIDIHVPPRRLHLLLPSFPIVAHALLRLSLALKEVL